MEIVTAQMLTGALAKALDAAAGEVGRQSWAALLRIVKQRRGRSKDGEQDDLPEVKSSTDVEGIARLAGSLEAAAAADPMFAAELAEWHRSAVTAMQWIGTTHSELSGVAGNVVQARDVSGGLHFHTDTVPGPRPQQLPGDVQGFVNRVAELRQLDEAFDLERDPARITVVVGTAGVGKTSLAVRWAHRIRERFPDGHLYANLRGYDPGEPVTAMEALERFLRSLDVAAERIPSGEEARAELFRSLVADRRMLIVLDNAATVGQVRPLLPGAAGCQVIVTSRSRLSGLVAREGARRVSVETLPEHESVALLRTTTAAYRPGDNDDELSELAGLCAHLPLALRIAAERAAARPYMPLRELIADLRDESGLWDALSADDEDEADAVRTVFAWSYRALPEDAAHLFRKLGLHPGPEFGLHAAAALASRSPSSTRRLIDTLIGAHLLEETGPGRYQFHDLLRAYALDQAQTLDSENERHVAVEGLLTYYLHAIAEARAKVGTQYILPIDLGSDTGAELPIFADRAAAMAWYALERNNLRQAVKAAVAYGLDRIAWRIPVIVKDVNTTVEPVNAWAESQAVGLAAARREGNRYAEAILLECFAIDERFTGRFGESEAHYNEARALYRQVASRRGVFHAENGIGLIRLRKHDLDGAEAHFSQALEIAQELEDPFSVGRVSSNLGETWLELGDLDRAAMFLSEGVRLLHDVGDRLGELATSRFLGRALCLAGRLPEARVILEEAMTGARDFPATTGEAFNNLEFARLLLAEGRPGEALTAGQQAAASFRRHAYQDLEASAWALTGEAFCQMARYDEAAAFFQQAANVHREVGNLWRAANDLHDLAAVLTIRGEPDRAASCLSDAIALLAEFNDPLANALRARVAQEFTT